MKGALTNILNLKIVNDSVWNQSTLPVKDGGLGIRSAYLSSYTASRDIAFSILPENIRNSQNPFFTLGCEKWMQKQGLTEIAHYSAFQSEWDKPLCNQKVQFLIENAQSETEKARLRSITSEGASAWLNALPLSSLGLKLSDSELPILCALESHFANLTNVYEAKMWTPLATMALIVLSKLVVSLDIQKPTF